MGQNIIEVRKLKKTFPNGFSALKGIDLEVRQGEFLVIVGLSGSGKSTLLRCINGLLRPSEGAIVFDGVDISQASNSELAKVRQKIAMIFQHFNLIERFTVLENVICGALSRTSTWRSLLGLFGINEYSQAQKLINQVGLEEKTYHRVSSLSGGQKQRVAIARALMQEPKVLLADEPVSSLDPATCHLILDYLKKINEEQGITIICNLHFLSLVRQYAHRVIALKDGQIVFNGSPADINNEKFREIYGDRAKEVFVT